MQVKFLKGNFINEKGNSKDLRLNPYKRISVGKECTVTVDGEPSVAIVDRAGKYSYINVGGTDYYVSGALTDGLEFTTEVRDMADPLTPEQREARKAEKEAKAEERAKAKETKAAEKAEKAAARRKPKVVENQPAA